MEEAAGDAGGGHSQFDDWIKPIAATVVPATVAAFVAYTTKPEFGTIIGSILVISGISISVWGLLARRREKKAAPLLLLGFFPIFLGLTVLISRSPNQTRPASSQTSASPGVLAMSESHHDRPGYLGVETTNVEPDRAAGFQLPQNDVSGALVTNVTPGSPAMNAGVDVNDIIRKLNDSPVTTRTDLTRLVDQSGAGTTIILEIWRYGQPTFLRVTLGQKP